MIEFQEDYAIQFSLFIWSKFSICHLEAHDTKAREINSIMQTNSKSISCSPGYQTLQKKINLLIIICLRKGEGCRTLKSITINT